MHILIEHSTLYITCGHHSVCVVSCSASFPFHLVGKSIIFDKDNSVIMMKTVTVMTMITLTIMTSIVVLMMMVMKIKGVTLTINMTDRRDIKTVINFQPWCGPPYGSGWTRAQSWPRSQPWKAQHPAAAFLHLPRAVPIIIKK